MNGLIRHWISEWMQRCIHLFCAFGYSCKRCVHWAYASGTDVCTEHTHQVLMRALAKFPSNMLSIRIRNWCVHWAYASGTDVCTERTHQELMRALSIHIRNLCVHWAYASGTYSCTEHMHQVLPRALSKGPIKQADHMHQELSVCSACA